MILAQTDKINIFGKTFAQTTKARSNGDWASPNFVGSTNTDLYMNNRKYAVSSYTSYTQFFNI